MQEKNKQIEYYEGLSQIKKDIYMAFAIKTTFSGYTDLSSVLDSRKKYTPKIVNGTIAEALNIGIIRHLDDSKSMHSSKYVVTYNFLAYIYTKLTMKDRREVQLENRYFRYGRFYGTVDPKDVAFFFYNMLYDQPDLTSRATINVFSDLKILKEIDFLNLPVYSKHLNKLNPLFLFTILQAETNRCLENLSPLSHIDDSYKLLASKVDKDKIINFDNLCLMDKLYIMGNYEEARNVIGGSEATNINGVLNLLQGKINEALKLFEKLLKYYRAEFNNKRIMMFTDVNLNYFYFALLLSLPAHVAVPRAKKILDSLDEIEYCGSFDKYFEYILKDLIGIKGNENISFANNELSTEIQKKGQSALRIVTISYLANIKLPKSMLDTVYETVEKAFNNKHYSIAYEAAYAMTQWFPEDKRIAKLYDSIKSNMSYEPAASFIVRVEDWEKSINLMVGALGGIQKGQSDTKLKENTNRIVYTFDNDNYEFKPILQTMGANGKWSKGRNISLKSFQEGTAKGMSEKDLRVSKYVRAYRMGSSNIYEFSDCVAEELVGHPLVFMSENIDIPVELVASKPIIKVNKNKTGYTLESDIKDYDQDLIIEKETNTRYKIYVLDSKIQELLRLLTTNKVVIPEAGVDKLTMLLGEISKHVIVQSDLITSSKNGSINVKEIDADSRIRIQLLPIGDGLKAELFVKPFNSAPPYAKPALGGKVLFANIDGEQLQVKRDFDTERSNYYTILENIQSLKGVDTSDELISFENPLDSLFLLDVILEHDKISVVEWPEGENFKITSRADFNNLNMRVKSKTNWFELDGELVIDDNTVISMQQLLGLMTNSHDRFVELNKGEFIALSEELRKRLRELNSYTDNSKNGIKINKYATLALDGLFDNLKNLKADKSWKDFRKKVGSKTITDAEIPKTLSADLRPYQEEGYKWMTRLAEMGAGACLADDMGLGKTLQTLAVLLNRIDKGPALVVCPVSIIGNWISEAQRFAPVLNIKILNSTDRLKTIDELSEGDVLVTSYGLLQSEEELFSKKEFGTIVLDEAHIIKNYATKTSKAIMKLKGDFRIALTGTPLQNHMGEIWNLFNFINPGLLGNLKHFTDTFIKPDDEASKKMLRKLIRPFILRRTKSSVLDELPPKTEIIKRIQLSDTEMAFYEALRRQALINLESDEGKSGAKHIKALAEITKLRQASCNPLLVDSNINIESSKLNTFLEIVNELKDNKHRALVFSQFVSHLSIVRKELDKLGIKYQYLDGSSPIKEREKSVNRFQKGEGDLFLISLKAGGLGLNLTAADFVIHLDPWWNPAIEDQASDRAHRFGQKRPVTIYRLVAENTIEEKIIKLHSTKRDLAESLLEGTDQSAKLSFTELVELMKG